MIARRSKYFNLNVLKAWEGWKAGIAEVYGLNFGGDYLAVGCYTPSLGDDLGLWGRALLWLLGVAEPRRGEHRQHEFKVEHRHAYTDITPPALA